MDVRTSVRGAFHEYFGNHTADDESISSLGGDSLDTIEIVMAIESDLDIEIDDSFIEDKFGTLSINRLIDELQLKFNIN